MNFFKKLYDFAHSDLGVKITAALVGAAAVAQHLTPSYTILGKAAATVIAFGAAQGIAVTAGRAQK